MERIYLDANVFIAFVKSEMGKPFRLMFRDVEEFFKACPERYLIVLSGLALSEIKKISFYKREETLKFFEEQKIKTELIEAEEKEKQAALQFYRKGMHYADALHAALAINAKCDALVTFNKKDFKTVENAIKVAEPAELIP